MSNNEKIVKVDNSKFKIYMKKLNFLCHYMLSCLKHGSKSQKYFNIDNYLYKYPDVRNTGVSPAKHYLLHGINEGRSDIFNYKGIIGKLKLFDLDYYSAQCNIEFKSYDEGLTHYLNIGFKENYNPSVLFNGVNYLKKYEDVANSNQNPLMHYIKYGIKEDRTDVYDKNIQSLEIVKKSGLFDYNYYKKYLTSKKSYDHALLHYLEIGYKMGYNPSTKFNGVNYLKKYPEVEIDGWNPLVYHVKYGIKEEKTDIINNNTKEYELIEESEFFDKEFYEKQCGLKFDSKRDAIFHYLDIGYRKGFNSCREFDGRVYSNRYPEIRRSRWNPLVHYVKYGRREGRFGLKEKLFKNFNEYYDVNHILNHLNKDVLIIIFISDINITKKCVENIYKTSKNFKVILFDKEDTSKDDITYFTQYDNLEIYKNINSHEGFIKCLNDIIKDNDMDVILLRDNIRTFDKWIMKLTIAAYSHDRIGFVSPISNFEPIKLINLECSENSAKIIDNISSKDYNQAPLSNDSCVFIRRDVFSSVSFSTKTTKSNWLKKFYEVSQNQGWRSIFDDSTYVYYESSNKVNKQRDIYNLSTNYSYENQPNIDFVNSDAFIKSHENIQYHISKDNVNSKKRILLSMHYGGGVELTVHDIISSMSDKYEFFILKSYKNKLKLYKANEDKFVQIREFNLKYEWNAKMIHSDEFTQIYFHILVNYNIDIVQIEHSIFHTFDLARVAKILDIHTIVTLHDFYYICPTYFLLDENNKYCGGYCGNKIRNCSMRVKWFDLPANIVEWKEKWHDYVSKFFDNCDMIITATSFTRDMFLEHYINLNSKDITLIEHGRDLIRYDNLNTTPNIYQPIKILVPGTIEVHKGSEFIKKLKEIDINNKLEFHYIGYVADELKEIGKYHGRYNRDDFAKYVYKIKPSFIAIFSICAETYSHTLTEAIASGVPVLASNIGALKTRIETSGGGWLVDINNPKETYEKIMEIVENKKEYKQVQKEMSNIKIVTKEEMGNNYKEVYEKLLSKKQGRLK